MDHGLVKLGFMLRNYGSCFWKTPVWNILHGYTKQQTQIQSEDLNHFLHKIYG
jgi:hypothetical protein